MVIDGLKVAGLHLDTAIAEEGFARLFIFDRECSLKIDLVNDVPFRSGKPLNTPVFARTDNILNILSNKITALSRYTPKDVVDIVFICGIKPFNWINIFDDTSEKDLWVNPINAAEIIEQFPVGKLQEIVWINEPPTREWFNNRKNQIIADILDGNDNTLCAQNNDGSQSRKK